jgi:hypothetical protein
VTRCERLFQRKPIEATELQAAYWRKQVEEILSTQNHR